MKTLTKIALGVLSFTAPAMANQGTEYDSRLAKNNPIGDDVILNHELDIISPEDNIGTCLPDKKIISEDKSETIYLMDFDCDRHYELLERTVEKDGHRLELDFKIDTSRDGNFESVQSKRYTWKDDKIVKTIAEVKNEVTGQVAFRSTITPTKYHPKYPEKVMEKVIEIDERGDGTIDYFVTIKKEISYPLDPKSDFLKVVDTRIEKEKNGKKIKVKNKAELAKVKKLLRYSQGMLFGISFCDTSW